MTNFDRTATRALASATCLAIVLGGVPARASDTIKCESKNGERKLCPADTSQGVILSKQRSEAGCWKDETWGYTSEGIWVSDDCRAEFVTGGSSSRPEEKKDEGGSGGKTAAIVGGIAAAAVVGTIIATNDDDDDENRFWGNGDNRVVRCQSRDNNRRTCRIGEHDRVEMRRQLSDRPCRRGSSWGKSRDYIWVDDGCRAEFWVEK